MKEEGFPIAYSKKENCFYYERSGSMIGYVFVEDDASDNDEKHAGGGIKIF